MHSAVNWKVPWLHVYINPIYLFNLAVYARIFSTVNISGNHGLSSEIAVDSDTGGMLVIPREGLQITF
jgi:hypothetical protein